MLTENSLKGAVSIAQFIKNYKQTKTEKQAFDNYNNDFKPQTDAYESIHGKSPNLLFKEQLDEINKSDSLVTKGNTGNFRGRFKINDYVWNSLFISGGHLKENPQLYISANAFGIKYGIDYGDDVLENNNIFVQRVLNDINIKNDILTILQGNTGIKLYNIEPGSTELPAVGSEILINSIQDIDNNWNHRSNLIGSIENQNINANSGPLIKSNLELLYPLYLKICFPNQGGQETASSASGEAKPTVHQDIEDLEISKKVAETIPKHYRQCKPIEDTIKGKSRNKIIYGAPGTGKSYELRKQVELLGFIEDNTVRVTFYPGYSYQQFIGTYKPTPIYKSFDDSVYGVHKSYNSDKEEHPFNKEPLIDYSFVPGPFITLLVKAIKAIEHKTNCNFMLIIEEINRANVASVFGDVFQLLDRDKEDQSEYYIRFNPDVEKYLKDELKEVKIDFEKIKIPKNLFIWATMNNADQGVMPLDSAFKRRWSFEYINIDKFKDKLFDNKNNPWLIKFGGKCYVWNELRTRINERLKGKVNEDKLLGPFFMSQRELSDPDSVLNKLLLYLREDVVRHQYELLFNPALKTFSDISKMYGSVEDKYSNCSFDALFENSDKFWDSLTPVTCPADFTSYYVNNDVSAESEEEDEDEDSDGNKNGLKFYAHYENASPELKKLYEDLNEKIMKIGGNITSEILEDNNRYMAGGKLGSLRFRGPKNQKTYILLTLKWHSAIKDPKGLTYDFSITDAQRHGIYKKVNIKIEEVGNKYNIDDIIDLVKQSYSYIK
jgi:predicted transport protein